MKKTISDERSALKMVVTCTLCKYFFILLTVPANFAIELAAVEEKKRQEAEKKKQLADQERQEMLALQEKVKNEALARRGKAAAASEVRPEQPGPPGSGRKYSVDDIWIPHKVSILLLS